MAWPPKQHITSYRNVFHCTQFALHRTASHRNVVHRIDSLCVHSLSLRTVWQRKALDRIASPRLVSPTHSIASHRIASHIIAHASYNNRRCHNKKNKNVATFFSWARPGCDRPFFRSYRRSEILVIFCAVFSYTRRVGSALAFPVFIGA